MKENAWAKVMEKCELESIAKRLFKNVKKRFGKRRKLSKGQSGSGSKDVRDAKEKFQDMEYLAWLEPFVKLRSTKSDFDFKAMAASFATLDALPSSSDPLPMMQSVPMKT